MPEHQPNGRLPAVLSGESNRPNRSTVNPVPSLVEEFPLFEGIAPQDRREILSAARAEHYPRRQIIFSQGEPIRQIILLSFGCVKITQSGQSGFEVILRLSGRGELVGTTGLCLRCNHCSTARAVRDSSALVWEAAVFESLSERFPNLRRNRLRILNECLLDLEERFREISTEKVAPRLGREIVRLLGQVGRRVNGYVEINLSREELAQLTGTTLFTVCRLLSQWERQSLVSTGRETVMVRNVAGLVRLYESE